MAKHVCVLMHSAALEVLKIVGPLGGWVSIQFAVLHLGVSRPSGSRLAWDVEVCTAVSRPGGFARRYLSMLHIR